MSEFETEYRKVLLLIKTRADLDRAYDLLRQHHKDLDARVTKNYLVGDKVFFEKRNQRIVGVIEKIGRSNVVVKCGNEELWEVPASQLQSLHKERRKTRRVHAKKNP